MSSKVIEGALWASLAEARQEAPISDEVESILSAGLALQGGNPRADTAVEEGLKDRAKRRLHDYSANTFGSALQIGGHPIGGDILEAPVPK
jgi:hypothetical protein